MPSDAVHAAERFTAAAECPACHRVDFHKMREPHPASTAEELAHWERERRTYEVRKFDGSLVRIIEEPSRPIDESVFEVIRVCRCGHEWGMV